MSNVQQLNILFYRAFLAKQENGEKINEKIAFERPL
jgi:hypothetical protein